VAVKEHQASYFYHLGVAVKESGRGELLLLPSLVLLRSVEMKSTINLLKANLCCCRVIFLRLEERMTSELSCGATIGYKFPSF
jgi:hypothetical protein